MRELLVVRHAIALDRIVSMEQGMDDTQRPLTEEGIAKMEQAANGLKQLLPDRATIITSPLLRAQQTAAILQRTFTSSAVSIDETLSPQYGSRELIHSLNQYRGELIAIVGHEPGLSSLIATLVCGNTGGAIELKKGGMALLRFDDKITPRKGTLRWLLTAKQLRLLGKA